ncbi:MAG: competence/damage-inducible protein A [Candidatus Eisenbacteria bacterium]|nr:competence/damage-inducible protein A [Candidatus Eisenbacteria bacterium]
MSTLPVVEILTIGDELLSGETIDTNSNYLDGRLEAWGWIVARHTTVGDDVEKIAEALREAASRADLVLTSGGLGPTEDDLTLEACARALGCGLHMDETVRARIEARFRSFGREMTRNNERQAMVPEIGDVIINESGTAPGFRFTLGRAKVFVLPGVPREVRWLMNKKLEEELDRGTPSVFRRTVKTVGLGESKLADSIESVVETYRDRVRFGYRAVGMETHVKLAVLGTGPAAGIDETTAGALLDEVEAALRQELGDAVYGTDEPSLVDVLAEKLIAKGLTVATAESCTGGLIGKMLTDRPGSSEYYTGGCVTYSDDSKVQLLGVDDADLEIFGAVSDKIVGQMAKGVRKRLHADWGIAASGIAGPDGATKDKPVGTVFIAIAGPDRLQTKRLQLPGDREMVRMNTAKILIDWLRRTV